jgi:hypothetical protein
VPDYNADIAVSAVIADNRKPKLLSSRKATTNLSQG